ncbi:hypothetical protein EGI31_07035 [Lacihabitans soyangensis]|uniref:Uncharacterized protein n=1 Tax=Lacihabitans soyangensis TaxID=869394 RepID=A0AAE3H2E3_9BACT|nr:hypothetical protein [Lacihabitans soyangensis]
MVLWIGNTRRFIYFVSAAAWAFIFFQKKTKQKKLHGSGRPSTNSHTQNSLNHQALKWILQFENFDCVQTVLAVIRNHSYLLFL